jgi:predicted RNase H-like nuclease (RuvC/YqgF family)
MSKQKKECRKVKFTDENSAVFTLKKISQTSISKKPTRAYLCKVCNSWHLTSRPDIFSLENEINNLKKENLELKKKIKELSKNENNKVNDVKIKSLKSANFHLLNKLSNIKIDKREVAEKVWNDIFNNDTLTYNNFEDYYKNNFLK